jgi:hypothetical protein
MKSGYNSSHQTIFVSLLLGKSAKAFQGWQNRTGYNPSFFYTHLAYDLQIWMRQIEENRTSEPHGQHSVESQLCLKWDIQDKNTSGKWSEVSAFLGVNPLFPLIIIILLTPPSCSLINLSSSCN